MRKDLSARYYQKKQKKMFKKKSCETYQHFSEEKKSKKMVVKQYRNLSEDEKQRLIDDKKNITKYAKFVINIKKVLPHPIIQRNTKISFFKKVF